jgi:hypothetical protein
MGAFDKSPNLAELDEQLGRIGRNNKNVWMRLDEDTGILLIGFAEFFTCRYCAINLVVEIRSLGNPVAIAAHTAVRSE